MKKNTKDTLFYSAVFIIYFFIALIFGNIFKNASRLADIVNALNNNPAVIVDAGHGGEDGGAIAIDGETLEKDLNLSIAIKLSDMLKKNNISTFMIRSKDESIYKKDDHKKTLRKKKIEDLKNRVTIANSNNKNILISIHQNKFTDESLTGMQIFYSGNNEHSVTLANFIKDELEKNISQANFRENKKANKEIYLLRNTKVPAIIIECGFISNKEELKKLTSEDYQNKIAQCIFAGIKNFLDKTNSN